MLRPLIAALFCLTALAGGAQASGSGGGGDKKPQVEASIGVHNMVVHPSEAIREPVTGVRLNITQFSYPGVPERAACRTVIRIENDSPHKVALYTLIRTYDSAKVGLGTWMTPSGELAPGQAGERLYSCKLARYMVLDRGSAGGWPNTCHVDGEERSPCPIQFVLDVNIDFLPGSPPPSVGGQQAATPKP